MARNPFAAAADNVNRSRRSASGPSSFWAGADTGRLMADWYAGNFSSDYEIRNNLLLLRARARSLVRDNPWVNGFIDEVANNVVGADGIMLQAKIMTAARAGQKPELATSTNKEIERGWKEWGNPEFASADGHDSWVEQQRLIIQTIAVDGECIIRRLRGFDNPFGYTLQFIDADLLDEQYNVPAGPSQNEIRMGVEIDRFYRPVQYWVWTRYSMDLSGLPRERIPIPAEDVLHLFVRYRSNQTRGLTWFAPILTSVKHLDGYEMNELVASRAAAAKMGLIVNKSADAISSFDPPKKGAGPKIMETEPGLMMELLPGQEFQEFDPTHPSTAYEMFTSTVLRAIARGLRVSYLTLTGDLRQANYSSMRAGLLPERDRWRALQVWMGVHCCRPVYRDWIRMSLLAGAIRVDSRLASEYFEVIWKGRGWKWVDPKNDLEAAKIEISLGVNSRQRIAAERGVDYEEIVEELEYEEQYAEEHNVDVSGVMSNTVTPTSADTAADPTNTGTPDPSLDGNPNSADGSQPKLVVA